MSWDLAHVELDEPQLAAAGGADALLPERVARRWRAAPLGRDGQSTIVAIGDARNLVALDDVRMACDRKVRFVERPAAEIEVLLQRLYGLGPVAAPIEQAGLPGGAGLVGAPGERQLEPAVEAGPGAPGSEPASPEVEAPPPPAPPARPRLLELLVAGGHLGEEAAARVAAEAQATGRSPRALLAEAGLVGDLVLARTQADEAGVEFVDLNNWSIEPQVSALIPESVARRSQLLGIGTREGRSVVAMANPFDVLALDDVRTLLGRDVVTVLCSPRQIEEYLLRLYRRSEEADLAARNAALSAGVLEGQLPQLDDLHAVVEEAPIVKFVNLILRQALAERASDIHVEPTAQELQVRFRIDGVLHHVTSSPRAIHSAVATRLKVMANLDIAEHRVPQDGRISIADGDREIDLRVATLPTVNGEKVVLRVLDRSTAPLDLLRLGFLPDVLARYERSYRKPSGTILVTGPTGSGKSTTLYATLNRLNSPERNLITVEDPVEYQLAGVNQVQVNPKAGLSFANALRSILRSDPDVVLVGEIRDRETAAIAVEAALTGHLVLSCLHTNDAASTPLRLVEMGVEPFLVCSALDCVLAQRLARVLCENCAQPYEPGAEELQAAGWREELAPAGGLHFRRAVGCQACGRTGYRGRIAVQEVMPLSEAVEHAVLTRSQSDEVRRVAVAEGMRTLRQDGLAKAALGRTSLEEILRVVL